MSTLNMTQYFIAPPFHSVPAVASFVVASLCIAPVKIDGLLPIASFRAVLGISLGPRAFFAPTFLQTFTSSSTVTAGDVCVLRRVSVDGVLVGEQRRFFQQGRELLCRCFRVLYPRRYDLVDVAEGVRVRIGP